MYPILYEQITAGTVPQHNGLGMLSDCISCKVEQARNDIYELTMEYPISGLHAEELAVRRVLKVKPNFTDNPQLFRINRISKVLNGKFTVFAKHIGYDLSGYDISSGTATSAAAAALLLQNAASGWSITTDKTTTGSFKIDTPASVKSYFVGREGSFLDVFGGADIKYDNFSVQFLQHAGQDRGVTIRYGKNLLELSQEIGGSNLYTHVKCYWKKETNVVIGDKVATGLTLDVPNVLTVDVSQDYEDAPTVQTLTTRAQQYINSNNLTVPTNNITLDFAQSGELANRVDLCDTVSVYYEALGITRAQVKCIRTVWDCIKEKYIETEFGDSVQTLADTIAIASKQLAAKPNISFMEEAVKHATELITGNLGGYVVLHDSNGDGEPDEILIMDTADITTATKVWRWNKNGLGYSGTGYSGSYGTAITADGKIVADFITTGTLNANLIKAGVISDVNSNSSIDMTNGQAIMNLFTAKNNFKIINASNSKTMGMIFPYSQGGSLQLNDSNENGRANLFATDNGGYLYLYNSSGTRTLSISGISGEITSYGSIIKKNGNGDTVANLFADSSGNSQYYFYDSSETGTIFLHGGSGNITCVSLTQTSSRKIKENIKPIDDAEKILELQAVKFDFKSKNLGTNQRGFIAEDVEKILPNLVHDGDMPSINYTGMIPYLQEVVKQQQRKIDDLESRIKALEKMIQSDKGD